MNWGTQHLQTHRDVYGGGVAGGLPTSRSHWGECQGGTVCEYGKTFGSNNQTCIFWNSVYWKSDWSFNIFYRQGNALWVRLDLKIFWRATWCRAARNAEHISPVLSPLRFFVDLFKDAACAYRIAEKGRSCPVEPRKCDMIPWKIRDWRSEVWIRSKVPNKIQ